MGSAYDYIPVCISDIVKSQSAKLNSISSYFWLSKLILNSNFLKPLFNKKLKHNKRLLTVSVSSFYPTVQTEVYSELLFESHMIPTQGDAFPSLSIWHKYIFIKFYQLYLQYFLIYVFSLCLPISLAETSFKLWN